MGWDAYAVGYERYKKSFRGAARRVKKKAGTFDWFLDRGGLDCSACAYMLEEATGVNPWDQDGWEPKKVKRLAREARWGFEYPKDRAWAYWSAREFLNVCARRGLRIEFSY